MHHMIHSQWVIKTRAAHLSDTHKHTCLDSLVLQGSSLTFDPAVKAVMVKHWSCWRICGSIRVHF